MSKIDNNKKQFGAGISYLLGEEGWGAKAKLAKKIGVSASYISDISLAKKRGEEEVRIKISNHFKYEYEHILALGRLVLSGKDPIEYLPMNGQGGDWELRPPNLNHPVSEKEDDPSTPSEFAIVPKYKAKLSGGPGSLETSDQIEANLMFRTEFLLRKGQVDKMALFEVTGESMQPFIYHGDVVLVDTSVNDIEQIIAGKTYAFRENGTVLIKRLSVQGGAIIASSENHQMNPPYHLDTESFYLIGRVVWVGHEVR